MNQVIVRKYGGSGLAKPEQIKAVAKDTAELRQQGHSVILVVSAMGQSTDQLVSLAHQISAAPNRRELDMLLSTGERVAMALVSMALHDLGCPAISFTGSQAGLFTSSAHSNALITDIKPTRVEEALQAGKVVVIAGFQGVNPETKEITTLGRGGSDTTAVAMAAHFQSKRCEVIKDVPGFCSADPRIVKNYKAYSHLPFAEAAEMCFWGAGILHYRSVELAHALGVPLLIGPSSGQAGTRLIPNSEKEDFMYEQGKILSVNSHKHVETYSIDTTEMSVAMDKWSEFLNKYQLPQPQIIAAAADRDHCRLMITGPEETLNSIKELADQQDVVKNMGLSTSSVTATCFGSVSTNLPERTLATLKQNGIDVTKMICSAMSLSFFVKPEQRESTVRILHGLSQ